jgi:predicted nucleic acid-binding protein
MVYHPSMRLSVNLEPEVHEFLSAYANANRITLSAAMNELLRRAEQAPEPGIADWQTLCSPFLKRLYGTNQVTDAYLLVLAVREGLVLVTMDKSVLYLAGPEHRKHVPSARNEVSPKRLRAGNQLPDPPYSNE